MKLLKLQNTFSYLIEDYGYFSSRSRACKYNTIANAIHTLLDLVSEAAAVFSEVELHETLVTSRS